MRQIVYYVHQRRKHNLLKYLLKRRGSFRGKKVLVFVRTRQRVKHLAEKLAYDGFQVAGIHKNQTVKYRQDIVDKFKDGELDVR